MWTSCLRGAKYTATFIQPTSGGAVPLLIAVAIVALVLRPIYVLALCDLYSDHLDAKGIAVTLPESPPKSISALVVFLCICLILAVVFMYRNELGVVDMLSTPYGAEYQPGNAK